MESIFPAQIGRDPQLDSEAFVFHHQNLALRLPRWVDKIALRSAPNVCCRCLFVQQTSRGRVSNYVQGRGSATVKVLSSLMRPTLVMPSDASVSNSPLSTTPSWSVSFQIR